MLLSVHRYAGRQIAQTNRGGLLPREDPREGRRPGVADLAPARRASRSVRSASASAQRVLRGLQPRRRPHSSTSQPPIEGITPRGPHRGAAFEVDVIVFAIGFDAISVTLCSGSTSGARAGSRCAASGRTSRAPTSVSGWPSSPTCSRHRAGQPLRPQQCVVAIEQHVDMDRRTSIELSSRRPRHDEPSSDAEAAWMDGRPGGRRMTLFPRDRLLYHGGQRAGQAAGLHDVRRRPREPTAKCDEIAGRRATRDSR